MNRFLLTGSTTWDNPEMITLVLDSLWLSKGPFVLTHGDAEGADKMGKAWAISHGHPQDPHKAEWRPDGIYNPLAGFERNEEMVDLGGYIGGVAFMMPCRKQPPKGHCRWTKPHPTHGTSHCATLARTVGIEVQIYKHPDLMTEEEKRSGRLAADR